VKDGNPRYFRAKYSFPYAVTRNHRAEVLGEI
jgi:hypothetical protein